MKILPMCYVCNQCVEDKTTHDCPRAKELLENPVQFDAPGIIWKTSGGTRGFGPSKNAPGLQGLNIGHESPTYRHIGMSNRDAQQFGD